MRLDDIVPIILTRDEAANIGRVLAALKWAREVVVVDSESTDATASICATFPNVRLVTNPFASHAAQWNFALRCARSDASWILALDADHLAEEGLADELGALEVPDDVAGFRARFVYCIGGVPIRSGVYTASPLLYRRKGASYFQDGHTQRLELPAGVIGTLRTRFRHDDRKPVAQWFRAQERYARLEAQLLLATAPERLRLSGWLRLRTPLMPVLAPLYCLFGRGGVLDGRNGWSYAFQRTVFELLLWLTMQELRGTKPADQSRPRA